jgi:hypothetical protein
MRFLGTHIGPSVGSAPATPTAGQIYYDTTANRMYVYDGTTWRDMTLGAKGGPFLSAADTVGAPGFSWAADPDTGLYRGASGSAALVSDGVARVTVANSASHVTLNGVVSVTGDMFTQNVKPSILGSATTPVFTFQSDTNTGIFSSAGDVLDITAGGVRAASFTNTVLTVRPDTANAGRITNIADPTVASDVATKNYVDGNQQPVDPWKKPVRAASLTNVASWVTASPPGTVGGQALTSGDRVLLAGQTTASENGIWVYQGAVTPPARASDATSATYLFPGSRVVVTGGSWIGAIFTYISGAFTAQSWNTNTTFAPAGGMQFRDSAGGSGTAIYETTTASGGLVIDSTGTANKVSLLTGGAGTGATVTSTGVGVGTRTTPAAAVDLPSNTVAAGGIAFGNAEYYLYRSAANTLAVDNASLVLSNTARGITVGATWTPTNANDVTTKAYVDNAVQGLDAKQSARLATTGTETFTITSGVVTQIAGTTIDTYPVNIGDRILIKNAPAATGVGTGGTGSSTQPGNGIYTVTGNTTNLTVARATDADAWSELNKAYVWVELGFANGGIGWITNVAETGTVNTTNIQWVKFASIQSTPINRSTFTIGDGSTTSFVITHNFNFQNPAVQVQEAGAPYNVVYPDVQMTSANTCTIVFATAPTTNQYVVTVIG